MDKRYWLASLLLAQGAMAESFTLRAAPDPAPIAMLAIGLFAIVLLRRRS